LTLPKTKRSDGSHGDGAASSSFLITVIRECFPANKKVSNLIKADNIVMNYLKTFFRAENRVFRRAIRREKKAAEWGSET
jgi:hypothetical protein